MSALIIGGGPAGAAVAIQLAKAGLPHRLVERTRETGDALCGGFLSWRSLASLEALGIGADELNPASVNRARLFNRGRMVERRLPAPARGVSRRRLDTLMLARAARLGARIDRGIGARGVNGREVRLDSGETLTPDTLFLATGKHDLRGAARPADARGDDPSLGLRIRLGPSPALAAMIGDAVELHLFDRGYAGLVMQEDGTANLCLAVRKSRMAEAGGPEALLAELGRASPELGDRLAWRADTPAIDAVANVPYGWRARSGEAGLFRLGDQAGVIPSLAGEGMGIAIASGIRAAAQYRRFGAAGALNYQRGLASSLARPLEVAGMIKFAAESPYLAPFLLKFADRAPKLIEIAARLTRIGHSPIDA